MDILQEIVALKNQIKIKVLLASTSKTAKENNNNINLQEYFLRTTSNEDILNNSDFWIADAAATVHKTSNYQGLVNLKKLKMPM
jgi:hypothetical protein